MLAEVRPRRRLRRKRLLGVALASEVVAKPPLPWLDPVNLPALRTLLGGALRSDVQLADRALVVRVWGASLLSWESVLFKPVKCSE